MYVRLLILTILRSGNNPTKHPPESMGRCFVIITFRTYEYLRITDDLFSGISTVRPEVISS